MDPFGSVIPPEEPAAYSAWYHQYMAGTYQSNWDFHRMAAASLFYTAYNGVAAALEIWMKGLQSNEADIDLGARVDLAWKLYASGPLLGATLTPVFALEAFTRYCAEVAYHRTMASETDANRLLADFDKASLMGRFGILERLMVFGPLSRQAKDEIDVLVKFRNAAVHDRPLRRQHDRTKTELRDGKTQRADPTGFGSGRYPRLGLDSWPLRLAHASHAAQVHDSVIDHFRDTTHPQCWSDFRESFGSVRVSSIRIKDVGGPAWTNAGELDDMWKQFEEWDSAIPSERIETRVREILARAAIKPV
jgi:hypothetical protein